MGANQQKEGPTTATISTIYDYDAFGNNTRIRDPDNNVATVTYNARGFKVAMTDPNMGTWGYINNAFGELVLQTDARGMKIRQFYDELGRMILRIDGYNYTIGDGSRYITAWVYDTASGKGIGRLHEAIGPYTTDGAGNGEATSPYRETYTYDDFGRPAQVVRQIDGLYFWSNTGYDEQSRVSTETSPASAEDASATAAGTRRQTISYEYNERGALAVVKPQTGAAYWTLGSTDALGNLTSYTLGNGASQVRAYDAATGHLVMNTASVGNTIIQSEEYQWYLRGSLMRRRDNLISNAAAVTEQFEYDELDRLTDITVTAPSINGGSPQTYSNNYSDSGRILSKGASNGGGYTNYAYTRGGHAVTGVSANGAGRAYYYDANGSMSSGGGRTITWTAANLPASISMGNEYSAFTYGPDRQRYKQHSVSPCVGCNCVPPATTTLYVGGGFERIAISDGTVKPVQYRHYIQAGGQTIAIHTEYSTGTGATTDYLHHDHLGSVVAITSSTGTLTERLSYDPWGKRRNATTNAWLSLSPGSQLLPATLALLPRGYTSHEHLDKLGLIHMNGRVYDPELGRFLSADPLIQFPESTQGFDRYAYVGNSPLSYTDPSGHGLLSVLGAIVSVAFPQFALLGKFMIAVDGYMEGGLQGALFSVASMAAAAGVGDMFPGAGNFGYELARAAVHGLIQGALSVAQGGKFGAAFLAAGVTSGYGSKFGQMGNRVTRVIGAAVLGGTVSRIGGGKFANGAVTGAFVQAFNHELDLPRSKGPGVVFDSTDDAAADMALRAGELSRNQPSYDISEYSGYIVPVEGGGYTYDSLIQGSSAESTVSVPSNAAAHFHTHPPDSPLNPLKSSNDSANKYLSVYDRRTTVPAIAKGFGHGLPMYLGASDGALRRFDVGQYGGKGVVVRQKGFIDYDD